MKQLSIILLLLPSFVFGQKYVDIAKLHYANTPVNQFDSATSGTRVQEYGLDFLYPIKLKSGNAVLTGFYAENISTQTSPANSNLTAVGTVLIKAGMNIKHSDKVSATYMLLPKLSSDFKDIGKKDFQLGAVALFKFKKSENFLYQAGMYYNGELFGPFFVPIVGFYYISPSKKFETNVKLPVSVDLNYTFAKRIRAGFNFNAFVRTFHLNEPYEGNPDNYLTKTTNEIYGYLQFDFPKGIILQTKVGYSIGRNYRVYDIEDRVTWGFSAFRFGDDREQLNSDFEDGMIFKAKLIYRFSLE
ncbi:MAG: DUF6268 family outer membrane beta-barrel protein [Salibacteraceae bacterium]